MIYHLWFINCITMPEIYFLNAIVHYFQLSGLVLLIFGVWILVDPHQGYLYDVVHISKGDPLLKVAAYLCVAVGCFSVIVGFLGCCGAVIFLL